MRWSRVLSKEVVGISSSSSDSVKISGLERALHVSYDSGEDMFERIKLYTLHTRWEYHSVV